MGFIKVIAQALLIYLGYRLVVNFIIPAYRNIKRIRKQFAQMQEDMNQRFNQNPNQWNNNQATQGSAQTKNDTSNPDKPKVGEYIDFEEIES